MVNSSKFMQRFIPCISFQRSKRRRKFVKVECFIDGPYGSPTREIMHTEHAVLVASGIGVTPYASILQSMMFRRKNRRVECPSCNHCFYPDVPTELMGVKKVSQNSSVLPSHSNVCSKVSAFLSHTFSFSMIGWFHLDKSRSEMLWVVRLPPDAIRISGIWGWKLWSLPWYADVYDSCSLKEWHERNWSPNGTGASACQKRHRSAHWS